MIAGVIILIAGVSRATLLASFFDLPTFGYFIICINLVAFTRLLLQVGVSDTIMRFYPKFEADGESSGLSSIVVLAGYLSLGVAMVIALLGFSLSSVIAEGWYGREDLVGPIKIAAFCSAGFLFSVSATAILRVQNHFHLALIFPCLGAIVGPVGILLLQRNGTLDLENAVLVVGLGELLGIVGTTLIAVWKCARLLTFSIPVLKLKPLAGSFPSIRSTLFHTSLFGFLQSGSHVGGIFLLGILGTPSQVALLGMATQLSRPLTLFQTSISSAVSPEVNRLHAAGKHLALYQFVQKYFLIFGSIFVIGVLVAWVIVPPLIEYFLKADYLAAVPVFIILLVSSGLTMTFQPLFPIAVARGEVGRRNLVVSTRFLYLGLASLFGLSAIGVVVSVLAGNLTVRLVNDMPLLKRLRQTCHGLS